MTPHEISKMEELFKEFANDMPTVIFRTDDSVLGHCLKAYKEGYRAHHKETEGLVEALKYCTNFLVTSKRAEAALAKYLGSEE